MIDAGKLLADLKRLRKVLDADLRETHASGAQRDAVQAEWQEAFDLGRTRDTFEAFLDGAFDQAVVHWVLGCVFLRFLEDNRLVDRPFLSGPGERLDMAKERQEAHFGARPHDSDTEYLLAIFGEAARLPGMAGLFDPAHNPLFRLPLSGDGAMALIRFFREVEPETGELANDFTDPDWNTRFLGDLYQDLSELARKRYALLQTPDFVESWILDRTLEPAIREFGHDQVTMIDPACGSGHFLLGGFARLLRDWQRFAPGLPPAEQAQRALDAIAGVDLNPFAVEIARFRLLVAALRAAGVHHLTAAPGFVLHLAAGDSLLHGRHFFRNELGGTEDGFRRLLRHHYAAENTVELDRILGRQYHAVVGNPPYITPKDPAMRDAYREIYASCHMKYGMGAPFTERFFDLALPGTPAQGAGFVGLITANNFMKREFGAKLIEEVLPRLDLTHVVDCSGAYIPGHGIPTVILLGRSRAPVQSVVRTVRGIRGEPKAPNDPARGLVWSAIVAQTDQLLSTSEFISTEDTARQALARHPWNMGGGGAADLQEIIEGERLTLETIAAEIGITSVNGDDDAFTFDDLRAARRAGLQHIQALVVGDKVRDYQITDLVWAVWPHDRAFDVAPLDQVPDVAKHLWPSRATVSKRKRFGTPMLARGLTWYEFQELYPSKLRAPLTITFGEVATHNHFVLDRGGKVFNRTAPVIKLPVGTSEEDHLGLLGLLNSSTACFWLRQVCHNKGNGGLGGGIASDLWERFLQINGSRLEAFPLTDARPLDIARLLHDRAQHLLGNLPQVVCERTIPSRTSLDIARTIATTTRARMIALQEELDWHCYRLYGLNETLLEHPDPPPLQLGERAFEIVMARQMAAGTLETAWFERHGSTPITDLPRHWPDDYRRVVEQRIVLIETDANIGMIERPEFKRRWSADSWEKMEQAALRTWLLDRMEARTLWTTSDACLLSTNQVADLLQRDADFLSVAALYAGRSDFNLEALVAELIAKESVPFLAAMRYTETGLRKRAQWEATWHKQRHEDAIDVEVARRRDTFRGQAERRAREQWQAVNPRRPGEEPEPYAIRMQLGAAPSVKRQIDRLVAEEQRRRKREEVGDIPVPSRYVTKDFQVTHFWRLRNGLDVPKERFVSFPHCQRDADGSLVVTWAGHNHLKRALAMAAYYQERKDSDGWPPERLVPLLAGVIELVPWLLQWHNEYDPELGARMGDYFVDFVQTEARALGMTEAAVAAWKQPAAPRRRRSRKAA
jgi:hypothetical protein